MRPSVIWASQIALLVIAARPVRADLPPVQCPCLWHRWHREGTPPPRKPRLIPHTEERAGFPGAKSKHAEPTVTSGGIGYYVGGGALRSHGKGRHPQPGTWGWDETGSGHMRRRVVLGWSQGRKFQGGAGAYRVDGHVPPDIIHAAVSSIHNRNRHQDEPATEQ